MAVDLATAKKLIAQRGIQAPEGADPDAWALEWLQNAISAGDPEAIKAAGGGDTEEGQAGAILPTGREEPTAAWLGKRKPTPAELKTYYAETGKSEDFKRFSAAQVAKWINDKWDVSGGYFTNDYGDIVEKPTESGPKSHAAGAATGEKNSGGGGGGGGSGKGGKGGKLGEWAADNSVNPDLQAQLLSIFEQGGGYFDPKQRAGVALQGGGMVWRDPETATPAQPATPAPATTTPGLEWPSNKGPFTQPTPVQGRPDVVRTEPTAPQPGASPGGIGINANPALVSATLNAFSPQAPSKQLAGVQPRTDFTPRPIPANPSAQLGISPVGTPTPATQPATTYSVATSPTTGTSPLMGALSQKFAKPNQWWLGGQKNYTY